ncbi:conserved protein of unknown function [Vibrio tapetis subsp. tapetis]|uniref:Uncharacterized protein n=2 Tax=Vibrio tapetis TaxID=52443 RepID=A0A2N8ZMH6_9VIBR|nr:conserved protein of unknown function [Vibrio tapetis subsp. tapetis]
MRKRLIESTNNRSQPTDDGSEKPTSSPQNELDKLEYDIEVAKKKHEAELHRLEAENTKALEEAEALKNQLETEQLRTKVIETSNSTQLKTHDTKQSILDKEHEHELKKLKLIEKEQELQKQVVRNRIKNALIVIIALLLIALLCLGIYRLYRWTVETPLIKEVIKKVEVPVETIVEKEKIVEKEVEVIPEECTQIRRNGKVYVSCDGVTIDGANTIGDSGLNKIPELITE